MTKSSQQSRHIGISEDVNKTIETAETSYTYSSVDKKLPLSAPTGLKIEFQSTYDSVESKLTAVSTKDDQINYTYASIDTERPPLPARLDRNPLLPIPSDLADDAVTYDSVGTNITKFTVPSKDDETYSNIDNDTKPTEELPPLVYNPLPPTPDADQPETNLLSTFNLVGSDLTEPVTELSVDKTGYTYASIDNETRLKKRPPPIPPFSVEDEKPSEAKLDSTYDVIGPSLSQSKLQAALVTEQASSTVYESDRVSHTYATVDISRKTSDENSAMNPSPPKPARNLPPPKPARNLPPPKPARNLSPPPVSDTLPDGYIYSEVTKKTKKSQDSKDYV